MSRREERGGIGSILKQVAILGAKVILKKFVVPSLIGMSGIVGIMLIVGLLLGALFTPMTNAAGLFNFTNDPSTEDNIQVNQALKDYYQRVSDSTVDQDKAKEHPDMNLYRVQWGLFAAIDKMLNNMEQPNAEEYAKSLKPNFGFKNITETTTVSRSPGGTSTSTRDVEVLDYVDTWLGRYTYNYKMVTTETVSYETGTGSDWVPDASKAGGHWESYTYTITVTTDVTSPQVASIREPFPRDYSKIKAFLQTKGVENETDIQLVLAMAKNYQNGGGVDVSDASEVVDLTGAASGYGAPPPPEWVSYFKNAADRYHGKTDVGEFEALLMAICFTESSFSDARTVVSSVGALGPMQFMPATWAGYAVAQLGYTMDDIWVPEKAIMAAGLMLSTDGAAAGDITGIQQAVFAYNHSQDYVDTVVGRMYFYGSLTGWTTAGGMPNSEGWVWPVPSTLVISSPFGPRTNPYTGVADTFHYGIDIPGSLGSAIVAAKDGTISKVEYASPSYGTNITIDHGNGVQSFYAHMYEVYPGIQVGTQVKAGTPIAPVGSAGYSTGPHLHFEIRVNGEPVRPDMIDPPH